jgi:hypothetical protein
MALAARAAATITATTAIDPTRKRKASRSDRIGFSKFD